MALAACSTSGRSALERSRQTLPCRAGRQRRLHVSSLLKSAEGVKVSWKQTTDEVLIKVPIADGVRGKEVACEVHPKRLKLQVQGKPVLEGSLVDAGEVDHDGSYWNIEEEGGQRFIQITLVKRVMGFDSFEQLLEADKVDASITKRVIMDVTLGFDTKRLVLGLFGNAAPRTVENFRALCTGEKGTSPSGAQLTFQGSPFHRIIPGFMAQGGDITMGNGMGGESIYGDKFEDENFRVKHEGRGYLAMANSGPNTNGSQFFILFQPTPHLDGKHVVFGKLEAGYDGLAAMEEVGTSGGDPLQPVTIAACQEVSLDTDPKQLVEEFRRQQAAAKQQQKAKAEGVEADQLPTTSGSRAGSPAPEDK